MNSGPDLSKKPVNDIALADERLTELTSSSKIDSLNLKQENPLLAKQYNFPFDKVRPEHIAPAINELIAQAQSRIDAICNLTVERTFNNTILALANATEDLSFAWGVISHLESSVLTPELKAAKAAVQDDVSNFFSSIGLSETVWDVVRTYASSADARSLNPEDARYLKKELNDFRRAGAGLSVDNKSRFMQINARIAKLATAFKNNVTEDTRDYQLVIEDATKLAGLPEVFVKAASERAAELGKSGWVLTIDDAMIVPALSYLDDRSLRKELYIARTERATIGDRNNTPIIEEIIELRREKALMLGYQHYADFNLEDRMAQTGAVAMNFLLDLKSKTQEAARAEFQKLQAFRDRLEGVESSPIEAWDASYYMEKLKKEEYGFDQNVLRPYFPYEQVLEGVFTVMQKLYAVQIKKVTDLPVWHPDVETFRISSEAGKDLGDFYVDAFKRGDKRQGAWMNSFIVGSSESAQFQKHVGMISATFQKVSEGSSLLTFSQAETLMHEMGHLMQLMLSEVKNPHQGGVAVPWDAVEIASQIMEFWFHEREGLDLLSMHYETGEPIPAQLFDQMKKAGNYMVGYEMMRQLSFGLCDLIMHTEYVPERDGSATHYAKKLMQELSFWNLSENYAFINGMTHLFSGGYAAGYYSYKWSEVIAADMFQTRFAKDGIFNTATGSDLREHFLSKGNTDEPLALVNRFMGRPDQSPPNVEPYLKSVGLISAE
jgi:oligopeptidase A